MLSRSERWSVEGDEFQQELDRRVSCAIADPRVDLETVSERAGGAFPTLVAQRLRALGSKLAEEPRPRLSAASDQADTYEGPDLPGPELHAAEFEWYFTSPCAAEIAQLVRPVLGEVLLLGAPTVADALHRRGVAADLVDRSPFLTARFGDSLRGYRRHELCRPLGLLHSHSIVFFDAPWHEDHLTRWLWQASCAVTRGGTIAFTLFGGLTRRKARVERERILQLADRLGNVEILDGALSYRTPRFERAVLKAAGLDMRRPWRRGDLVIVSGAGRSRIPAPRVPSDRVWWTRRVGDEVMKVAPGVTADGIGPEFTRPTVLLDTVSRSRMRSLPIAVWTSRSTALPLAYVPAEPSAV